nr:hypothetical protein [Tanacetum cinerariifolium]
MNILKSIDEGPYQMGIVRESLAEGTEGAPHLGPERPRVYSDLSSEEKDRYNHKGEFIHDYYVRFTKLINDMRNIKMTMPRMQLNSKFVNNMLPEWARFVTAVKLNKGLRDSNYDQLVVVQNVQGRQNRGQGMTPRSGGAARYGGVQNRVRNVNPGQARLAQEDGVALDAEQLLFLADPVTDEVGPSYDSDILSEVQDHVHYQDAVCAHHEEHAMHDNVQLNHVVDSHAYYTSDSNMILYDQYVKDNEVPVVHSNVSSVPNDAFMMIYNEMCKPYAQSVSNPSRNTVVKNLLTVELATYKEQVELYERRAKFKLTEREQKINKQLRLVISDRNFKEETLKRELHSIKLQLASTINHNKSMVEEVTFLKKDFTQKENKYLEDFLDMKSLKEKVKDMLLKQDQSLQTVHMLCRPKPYYNELNKKHDAIERKNLLIANDNLIAECLSKEVFSVATHSELNVARFTEMHVANNIVEARCLELEAELANLRDKSHHDNPKELINNFSKLEVNHLNLQLKYQILKESIGNNPPTSDKDTPNFDSVFVIGKIQASLQGKDNVIRQLKKQTPNYKRPVVTLTVPLKAENDKIKQHYKELYDSIKITRAKHLEQVAALTTKNVNLKAQILEKVIMSVRIRNNRDAHLNYLRHLKESVETIHDIVEEAKVVRPLDRSIVSACRYTKHSQELLEYAIGTCPQGSQQRDKQLANIPLIRKKQVTFTKPSDKLNSNTHKHVAKVKTPKTNVPVPLSTGVNSCPNASGS